MDDPISALDANVKKKIFQNVFMGALKEKTRVLVTHAVDFLHLVDKVIVLKDGEIVLTGNYEDIQNDAYLKQLMKIYKSHQTEQHEMVLKGAADAQAEKEEMIELNQVESDEDEDAQGLEELVRSCDPSLEQSLHVDDSDQVPMLKKKSSSKMVKKKDLAKELKKKKNKGKMMTDEDDEKISVGFHVWWHYFSTYYGFGFFCAI